MPAMYDAINFRQTNDERNKQRFQRAQQRPFLYDTKRNKAWDGHAIKSKQFKCLAVFIVLRDGMIIEFHIVLGGKERNKESTTKKR